MTMSNKFYHDADNLPPSEAIPSGTGFEPVYRLDPVTDLVIRDGERDLQSMIQAAEDSCRIDKILKRYEQTGDETLFQQRATLIADLTSAPGTIQEAYMLLRQCKESFDSLPPSMKDGKDNFADFVLSLAPQMKSNKEEGAVS